MILIKKIFTNKLTITFVHKYHDIYYVFQIFCLTNKKILYFYLTTNKYNEPSQNLEIQHITYIYFD